MRDYQPNKNNPHRLPQTLYKRMLDIVRDYERMVSEIQNASGANLAELNRECKAVEQAIMIVPEEYRKAVWENVCYHAPYPVIAGEATYKRWKSRFVYKLAENLCKI